MGSFSHWTWSSSSDRLATQPTRMVPHLLLLSTEYKWVTMLVPTPVHTYGQVCYPLSHPSLLITLRNTTQSVLVPSVLQHKPGRCLSLDNFLQKAECRLHVPLFCHSKLSQLLFWVWGPLEVHQALSSVFLPAALWHPVYMCHAVIQRRGKKKTILLVSLKKKKRISEKYSFCPSPSQVKAVYQVFPPSFFCSMTGWRNIYYDWNGMTIFLNSHKSLLLLSWSLWSGNETWAS